MANRYDNWLSTTPEDEEDEADEREARRNAAAERALDRAEAGYDPVGREADFIYDPLGKRGFE